MHTYLCAVPDPGVGYIIVLAKIVVLACAVAVLHAHRIAKVRNDVQLFSVNVGGFQSFGAVLRACRGPQHTVQPTNKNNQQILFPHSSADQQTPSYTLNPGPKPEPSNCSVMLYWN